jgi:hypothetical protein
MSNEKKDVSEAHDKLKRDDYDRETVAEMQTPGRAAGANDMNDGSRG